MPLSSFKQAEIMYDSDVCVDSDYIFQLACMSGDDQAASASQLRSEFAAVLDELLSVAEESIRGDD